jgi:Family of unknown function (DUF6932)
MAIPDFDENGLLPTGVHTCTLEEVEERFGRFRTTDRRADLLARLRSYVREAIDAKLVKAVIIDGSFVTAAATPNDIDIVIVPSDEHESGVAVRPFEYNVLSTRRVRRRFGFDALIAHDNTEEYEECIAFYQQVRGERGVRKGLLRLEL